MLVKASRKPHTTLGFHFGFLQVHFPDSVRQLALESFCVGKGTNGWAKDVRSWAKWYRALRTLVILVVGK